MNTSPMPQTLEKKLRSFLFDCFSQTEQPITRHITDPRYTHMVFDLTTREYGAKESSILFGVSIDMKKLDPPIALYDGTVIWKNMKDMAFCNSHGPEISEEEIEWLTSNQLERDHPIFQYAISLVEIISL